MGTARPPLWADSSRFDGTPAEPLARVLVVDDDMRVARGIRRVLVQLGLAVDVAADGREALAMTQSHIYDVMVLDLRMTDLDGLDVVRALQSQPNAPQTILHSAYLDVSTAVTAMKCGVADVIEKPVSPGILRDRVLGLVRERQRSRVDAPIAANIVRNEPDPAARLLGQTSEMVKLRDQIRRVSRFTEVSVLIEGETGTGKELVAEAIHALTASQEAFVSVNCAAIPDHLFESELFGHEAGAFTSAKGARAGLFEEAGRGTIFLDEVGEMPPALQPKLLRVLESRQFRRVGSNRSRRLEARIISATNRALSGAPDEALRTDVYFRLAGYTIVTPNLRERMPDLPLLAQHFLAEFAKRYDQDTPRIADDALDCLIQYEWPGNVRELRVVIENAAMLAAPGTITAVEVEHVLSARRGGGLGRRDRPTSGSFPTPSSSSLSPQSGVSLPDLERELIMEAFALHAPNLSKTAKHLGIPRSTLRDKLRKLGLL